MHCSLAEWALLKAMVIYGCLAEEINSVQDTFAAIDVVDINGKISFDELLKICDESGHISKKGAGIEHKTPSKTPHGNLRQGFQITR